MKLIEREYLTKLINVRGTPDIKVITGIRRSGKSKLLDSFYEYLCTLQDANIIRIKLNLKKFESLKKSNELYRYIDSEYKEKKDNYILIDEIQMCDGFEEVINSLHEEERFDIYLTGSNAFLLSSDLATLFGGRVFELNIYPFSYKEYMKYYELDNVYDCFDDYVTRGGMSGSYLYNDIKDAYKYVEGIYKSTILKDIIKKY